MRTIATSLTICLFAALALGLGVLSFGEGVPSDVAAPAVSLGDAPAQAPEFTLVPDQPNVWVEAVFVELDRKFTHELERRAGFKLSPPDGKTILTSEEKERLLAAIEKTPGARIISSLSALTINGQQTQSEDVEELTFPTEYDTETINVPAGGHCPPSGEVFMVTPGNWKKRDVGAILNVTPTILDEDRIALVLMPEITLLVEWINYGNETYPIMQPVFRTWNKTTTVIIPDGSSFVLKESPIAPFPQGGKEVPQSDIQPREKQRGSRSRSALKRQTKEKLIQPDEGQLVQKPTRQTNVRLNKLELIIPEVKFENASLKEVVDFLSRECDVNIVLLHPAVFEAGERQPLPPGGRRIPPLEKANITLRLKNVPLKELLKYVLKQMNLKYTAEDHDILITPLDYVDPESLETEIFRFPELAGAETLGPDETFKDFLRQSGIAWPRGSNLTLDRKTGTLIVTNTPDNMALIREMVHLWDQPAPPEAVKHPDTQKTLLTIISAKVVEAK